MCCYCCVMYTRDAGFYECAYVHMGGEFVRGGGGGGGDDIKRGLCCIYQEGIILYI